MRVFVELDDARVGKSAFAGRVAEIYFHELARAGFLKVARMFEKARNVEVWISLDQRGSDGRRIGPWFVTSRSEERRVHVFVRPKSKWGVQTGDERPSDTFLDELESRCARIGDALDQIELSKLLELLNEESGRPFDAFDYQRRASAT